MNPTAFWTNYKQRGEYKQTKQRHEHKYKQPASIGWVANANPNPNPSNKSLFV